MKGKTMKNYQTPRQLADCEFAVGHREAQLQREFSLSSVAVGAIALLTLACYLCGVFA